MRRREREYTLLLLSILCFLVMSVSFLLMPFGSSTANGDGALGNWLPGVMFWTFLLAGVVIQVILAIHRRRYLTQYGRDRGRQSVLPGVFSFFRNVPGILADISTVVGILGFILSMIATHAMGYICYIFLAFCVFSFCLHCIFNGKIYHFVKHILGRRYAPRVTEIEKKTGVYER